jgi:hypothetical protein
VQYSDGIATKLANGRLLFKKAYTNQSNKLRLVKMEQVAENAAKISPDIYIIGNGVIAKALAVALTRKKKR